MPLPRRVAVLYQAVDPPVVNGVRKPLKPGGYQDSGADIAYNLKQQGGTEVLTLYDSPDPADDTRWCFPDTEDGIIKALSQGATHLWANTILFESHPLQASAKIREYQDKVSVVGQPPCLVQLYDDKHWVNELLRKHGSFSMPHACVVSRDANSELEAQLQESGLRYPVVAKPVRGRGSFGVKVCSSSEELRTHLDGLFGQSPNVIVEEYLAGEETTITVMPPSENRLAYWSLPTVTRFNHEDGIAPYNGTVAVTSNSRVISAVEYENDSAYAIASKQCEAVAELLRVTAPIRVDTRRRKDKMGSPFVLFDVNMKPNMTGPGRPGRDNQAGLTTMAAAALGWDYPRLLCEMLNSASALRRLQHLRP